MSDVVVGLVALVVFTVCLAYAGGRLMAALTRLEILSERVAEIEEAFGASDDDHLKTEDVSEAGVLRESRETPGDLKPRPRTSINFDSKQRFDIGFRGDTPMGPNRVALWSAVRVNELQREVDDLREALNAMKERIEAFPENSGKEERGQ